MNRSWKIVFALAVLGVSAMAGRPQSINVSYY